MSDKYRLANQLPDEMETQVCIRCGKKRQQAVTPFRLANGQVVRPNTTGYIKSSGLVRRLDCLLGAHEYYFEREVEPNQ